MRIGGNGICLCAIYSLIYNIFVFFVFLFSWDIASFHFKLFFFTRSFQISSTRLENRDYIWNSSSNMHCHLHLKSTVQTIISKVQFFFSIRKETYQVGLVWSTLVYPVYFGQFQFIRSTSFTSVQFGPLWSLLVQFSLLQSIPSTSVQFCIFSPFCPLRSIWSNLIHFSSLQSIWSNSVYLLKNGKRQVLVEP